MGPSQDPIDGYKFIGLILFHEEADYYGSSDKSRDKVYQVCHY
jgi:hypothetical protein